ncbi:hypothetical protein SAMN02745202_00666 [Segatella oulorum]|uniref:Uncharacterized protein n=1 Tax=Segatella oulorum TaxID=28136 RepID=A0A1T4M7K4_9BACT|nr:hypothetical protein SAMN02745202_00666 [Segatella oulorum]
MQYQIKWHNVLHEYTSKEYYETSAKPTILSILTHTLLEE